MNPRVTFTTFIQPPLFGAFFNHVGKRAKSVKGRARAIANPSMPIVGERMLPMVDTSTSSRPMIGLVQLKETRTSVKAIRKMLSRPVVVSALLFTLLFQRAGRVISKPPKKLAAKMSSSRKKKILKKAFVERSLSLLTPKRSVMKSPSAM